MVSQARSQRLVFGALTSGTNSPQFHCPSGFTTLLKQLYAHASGSTAARVHLVVTDSTAGAGMFVDTADVPAGTTHAWAGWLALHPGDGVYVFCETGPVAVYVSGAVLVGAPLFPSGEQATPLSIPISPPVIVSA